MVQKAQGLQGGVKVDQLKGVSELGEMTNDFSKEEAKEFSEDIARRDWEGQDNMAQCVCKGEKEKFTKEECL